VLTLNDMKSERSNDNGAITEDVVRYVAKLSRLSFSDEDVAKYKKQIGEILGYITQLNEVDTADTQPTSHVLPSMKNVFREDLVKTSLSPDKALSNAPDKQGDFFRVPRVI